MRESESGTLPRAKVWYGAKPNNRVSQQTQAKSELLAKGGLVIHAIHVIEMSYHQRKVLP